MNRLKRFFKENTEFQGVAIGLGVIIGGAIAFPWSIWLIDRVMVPYLRWVLK